MTTDQLSDKISNEFFSISFRLLALSLIVSPLPNEFAVRTRTAIMRLMGLRIGPATVFADLPTFTGGRNVMRNFKMGSHGFVNVECLIDCSASIKLGNHVFIGQRVNLITGGHQIGDKGRRASYLDPKPIRIHSGTWIGAGATVLPGVTIHEGAIVAAGAVVTKDVPPNHLVAGIPARCIRELPIH